MQGAFVWSLVLYGYRAQVPQHPIIESITTYFLYISVPVCVCIRDSNGDKQTDIRYRVALLLKLKIRLGEGVERFNLK